MSTGHKARISIGPKQFSHEDVIVVTKNYKGKETMGKTTYVIEYPGKVNDQKGKGGFNFDSGILILDLGEWDIGGPGIAKEYMVAKLNGYKDVVNAKGIGQLRYGGGNGHLYQNIEWIVLDIIDLASEDTKSKQPKKKKKKATAKTK